MSRRLLDVGGDFGDYRVVKLLGTSGRVDVYLMRLTTSGRFFAMKTFLPPDGAPADFGERFAEAISNVMNVRNDNLVQVYDSGIDPKTGLFYLITDYVDGGTLAEYIAINGALKVADALKTAIVAANALEAIHAAGMTHGGITSGNTMFMQDGMLKLTDIGMAKASPSTSLLCVGAIKKDIPPYVAPEQVLSGAKVDRRADIYSLGVVLFEMLTGKRPDAVSTVLDMIVRSTNNELIPDVRSLRSDVPAVVAEAVAKLCAPKAEERPQSAGDAAELLMSALREIGGADEIEKSGGGASKKSAVKLRRGKMRLPKKLPDISAMSEERHDEGGGGLGKLFAVLVILAIAVGCAIVFLRKDKSAEDVVVQPVAEVEEVNDSTVRSAKVGDFTWFYTIEHSKVVLWRGLDGFHGKPCLEPAPTGRVVVPDSIDGFAVGALGSLAFHDCADMTEIVLPASLERVGNRAFILCRSLKAVELPSGVKSIGKWAFNSCAKLRRIDISNCEEITDDGGNFAFCPALEEIAVASGNTKFKAIDGALYSADGKRFLAQPAKCESVEVPEGVEEIGAYAFCDSQAKRIELPSSVVRIGQGAFENCRSIRELSFAGAAPDITQGKDSIFKNATKLLSVSIKRGADGWPSPGSKWPAHDGRIIRYAFSEISRQWHDTKGRAKEATLVGIADNGTVAIMRNPGEDRVRSLTISKLSSDDQKFIASISSELRKYEKRNDRYEPAE